MLFRKNCIEMRNLSEVRNEIGSLVNIFAGNVLCRSISEVSIGNLIYMSVKIGLNMQLSSTLAI